MLHVYGIKNCETVKKSLAWLDSHGTKYTFHDFKKETLAPALLDGWIKTVGWETLLNRKGTTWRGLPEKVREGVNEKSARALMLENPSIIKRPVVIKKTTVTVGFDVDVFEKNYR